MAIVVFVDELYVELDHTYGVHGKLSLCQWAISLILPMLNDHGLQILSNTLLMVNGCTLVTN